MKLDNANHPVSQTAMRVFFGCFIGFAVLAIMWSKDNHVSLSITFRVTAIVLAFITLCALIAYFRPRGIAAFIKSTAYVGIFVIGGIMLAGVELVHLNGIWVSILAILSLVGWTAIGIYRATASYREARKVDQETKERRD